MTRRLSYCLFSGVDVPENSKQITMSGLFCWEQAFQRYGNRGFKSANSTKELLEEFDIIHVNFTPGNSSYIAGIRDALGEHSDTKIVTQVDFSPGLWNSIDPYIMRQQLSLADFVFHVEPTGARILSQFLGYTVPELPHPADVDAIRKYSHQPKLPPLISAQYHRYMYTWHPYFYGAYKFRRDPEFGARLVLMNYDDTGRFGVPIDAHFDDIVQRAPYEIYLQFLADCIANIDITPDFTYGRGIVDAAAVGLPTIGSISCAAANRIWPHLAVPPYDTVQIERNLESLLTDGEFAAEMSVQGVERSKYYSLKNSYNRMVRHLEEADLV